MASLKRYRANAASGLCGNCGRKPTDRRKLCEECKTALRNFRYNRIKQGLCTRCAKKAEPGFRTCVDCREENLKYQKENKPTRKKRFFMNATHQVRATRKGKRPGMSNVTASSLMFLWKMQKGICALTGLRLTRENAEVDHILPFSRGGSKNTDNLQWVIKDVNRAKQGLTDSEFIDLCGKVVRYAERTK